MYKQLQMANVVLICALLGIAYVSLPSSNPSVLASINHFQTTPSDTQADTPSDTLTNTATWTPTPTITVTGTGHTYPQGTPHLIAPANGTIITQNDNPPYFSVNPPNETFWVNFILERTDDDYVLEFCQPGGVYSWCVELRESLPAGNYVWHAQACNPWGCSYSEARFFTVQCLATMTPPTLASPAHDTYTTDTTPTFMWFDMAGAASYRIWLYTTDRSFEFKSELSRQVTR